MSRDHRKLKVFQLADELVPRDETLQIEDDYRELTRGLKALYNSLSNEQ